MSRVQTDPRAVLTFCCRDGWVSGVHWPPLVSLVCKLYTCFINSSIYYLYIRGNIIFSLSLQENIEVAWRRCLVGCKMMSGGCDIGPQRTGLWGQYMKFWLSWFIIQLNCYKNWKYIIWMSRTDEINWTASELCSTPSSNPSSHPRFSQYILISQCQGSHLCLAHVRPRVWRRECLVLCRSRRWHTAAARHVDCHASFGFCNNYF